MSLQACGVTFGYPGGRLLYQGLSLEVAPGERAALSAPSGAGKTTLCRILAGYLEPQAGPVLVDGAPLVPLARRRGAAARTALPVQLLAQHPEQAFDPRMRMGRSLREGAAGLSAADREAVDAALDAYAEAGGVSRETRPGASVVGSTLPNTATDAARPADGAGDAPGAPAHTAALLDRFGIRPEWLARFPHELSGGELMRFAMVRALIAQPRYLIADESTAMLDAVTQAQLWRALIAEAEARGLGMVLVSHSPALVRRVATRVVALALSAGA